MQRTVCLNFHFSFGEIFRIFNRRLDLSKGQEACITLLGSVPPIIVSILVSLQDCLTSCQCEISSERQFPPFPWLIAKVSYDRDTFGSLQNAFTLFNNIMRIQRKLLLLFIMLTKNGHSMNYFASLN